MEPISILFITASSLSHFYRWPQARQSSLRSLKSWSSKSKHLQIFQLPYLDPSLYTLLFNRFFFFLPLIQCRLFCLLQLLNDSFGRFPKDRPQLTLHCLVITLALVMKRFLSLILFFSIGFLWIP